MQITYARDVETEVELEDIAGEGRHRREYEHDATRNKAIYGRVLKAKTEIEK